MAAAKWKWSADGSTKQGQNHQPGSLLHNDELTSTIFGAIQQLNQHRKATFLLDTALALIDAGQWVVVAAILDPDLYHFLFRYGAEVENYLEVYLRTPGLAKSDVTRALLARGSARKQGGEPLLAKADHGTVPSSIFPKKKFWYCFYQIFKPSWNLILSTKNYNNVWDAKR